MEYNWIDLPERKSCFTTRNAVLYDMDSDEIIQYYSANTKIVVVQGCTTDRGTFYRTESAVKANVNFAFEASALGLPNEIAPPCSSLSSNTLDSVASPSAENFTTHKHSADTVLPSGGEATLSKTKAKTTPKPKAEVKPQKKSFFKRLFRL